MNNLKKIHPSDYLYQYVERAESSAGAALSSYFETGLATANAVANAIGMYGYPRDGRFSILDFASGYGRVTRHLPWVFQNAEVFASDIHSEAVAFIKETFGASVIQSTTDPGEFRPGRTFDIIFVVSLFSHLPSHAWGQWFRSLAKSVSADGLLLITTHGRKSIPMMWDGKFDSDGYFFKDESEQADLDVRDYGNCATTFEFVHRHAQAHGMRLLMFQESAVGHQDLYIFKHETA